MTARLDAALAARGMARSRTHASALIATGVVRVDGRPVSKSSSRVEADTPIEVAVSDPYVSRAAHKLIAGLDAFGIEVSDRVALDMGASTGGFTQVLRERGADPVVAVDVGHGQLAAIVAADPGVVSIEGFNVRHMTRAGLAAASGVSATPDVITGDLSFISVRHVLPAVSGIVHADTDVVLLVKPQFEVGRAAVNNGVVTDPVLRRAAVMAVLGAASDVGLGAVGVIASPIRGTHGNREVLVHLRPGGAAGPSEWTSTVAELTGS